MLCIHLSIYLKRVSVGAKVALVSQISSMGIWNGDLTGFFPPRKEMKDLSSLQKPGVFVYFILETFVQSICKTTSDLLQDP